jgi:hypothetical protein
MKLYEIVESLKDLEEMAENDEALIPYLDSVEMQMNDKVSNIVRFSRECELKAEMIETEIQRLKELKESYKNKAENLKEYLAYSMKRNGIERIDTEACRLSFRKSKQVIITGDINKKFTTKKTIIIPDKKAIKEAIEKGEEVKGAILRENKNLVIK